MSMHSEWKPIAARIKSLINATNALAQLLAINSGDSYCSKGSINDQASDIFLEIKLFFKNHENSLQPTLKSVFDSFINGKEGLFLNRSKELDIVKGRITLLATLEGQITYLMSDKKENIRRQTELAFIHLQRSIMADKDIKTKWNDVYSKGETNCEELGALHLLQHGIWTFKANAAGGRTDLIIGEPLNNLIEVEKAAYGLVLTEWKIARKMSDVSQLFAKAKEQAAKYSKGVLAGIELTDYRYLVVVTDQKAETQEDIFEDNFVYRHIIVNVNPQVPSKQ